MARGARRALAKSALPIGAIVVRPRTGEGKLHHFVAIDRTSKPAFAQLMPKAPTRERGAFLEALVAAVPCEIHTVLTDCVSTCKASLQSEKGAALQRDLTFDGSTGAKAASRKGYSDSVWKVRLPFDTNPPKIYISNVYLWRHEPCKLHVGVIVSLSGYPPRLSRGWGSKKETTSKCESRAIARSILVAITRAWPHWRPFVSYAALFLLAGASTGKKPMSVAECLRSFSILTSSYMPSRTIADLSSPKDSSLVAEI